MPGPRKCGLFRDGARLAPGTTFPSSGSYRDNIDRKGGGSYRYQVCEPDRTLSSGEVTVTC